MPRIIEHGKTSFEQRCNRCLCHFSYTLDELTKDYAGFGGEFIGCPGCGEKCKHRTVVPVVQRRAQ